MRLVSTTAVKTFAATVAQWKDLTIIQKLKAVHFRTEHCLSMHAGPPMLLSTHSGWKKKKHKEFDWAHPLTITSTFSSRTPNMTDNSFEKKNMTGGRSHNYETCHYRASGSSMFH